MTVIVFINDHHTALFTWHDLSSEIHSYLSSKYMQLMIRSLEILTHIECSIVITYHNYENCHYYATIQASR